MGRDIQDIRRIVRAPIQCNTELHDVEIETAVNMLTDLAKHVEETLLVANSFRRNIRYGIT